MKNEQQRKNLDNVVRLLHEAETLARDVFHSLTPKKIIWVNLYQKLGGEYYAGSDTHPTDMAARFWHSDKNKNKYVGAFPVILEEPLAPFQSSVPVPESQYTSLANMDWQKHEALVQAARLFFGSVWGDTNIIKTIKYIRTLTGSNLMEAKQLVDYVIKGEPSKPLWFKSRPIY